LISLPGPDSSGNIKFQTSTDPLIGALYLCEEGGLPNQATFESEDGMISFYFRSISHIETDVSKNRSELSLLIATGDFVMTLSGTTYTGIVYLDGKETLKRTVAGK
jgi:hypothetical protein